MRLIKWILKKILFLVIMVCAVGGVCLMTLNNHVVNSEKDNIVSKIEGSKSEFTRAEKQAVHDIDPQCAIVLGAGIKDENTPTPMLKDRLDTGILLYKHGLVSKLLLSGDNGTAEHNEIHVMLNYCLDAGIPEEDIYCDHAGFSTYDSMYRAKEIFQVERAVIVTQTYHEYRSLYIAEKMDIKCVGVSSDQEKYSGQPVRELREIMARIKDFFKCMVMPAATLGGDIISLFESGVLTHGE